MSFAAIPTIEPGVNVMLHERSLSLAWSHDILKQL